MTTETEMLIAMINENEWWIGESIEACVERASQEYGHAGNSDDMEQYEYAHTLTDEALDSLKYVDADENEEPTGEVRTFREQLAREIAEGGEFPRLFAATDY